MKRRHLSLALISLFAIGLTATGWAESPTVPTKKQTSLRLYVSAEKAYAMWQADPRKTFLLDVRTPEEYIFVGHTPMARHIPVKFLDQKATAMKARPVMAANSDFVDDVRIHYGTTDKILIMCRSGGRSAAAVNQLAKAGFTSVYSIIDGFEGDLIKDKKSIHRGKRKKNGWKNTGAPWTYKIDPELVYHPKF